MTPSGTVSIQSDTWTAQFTDENGKSQRISTKTTVRSVAEQMLAKYQTEVDRIRTGVATRDELSKAHLRLVTLEEARKLYQTKMVADGSTPAHITITLNRIIRLCKETGIDSVPEIRRETVVKWIANEVEKKVLALNTINDYLKSMKSFAQYLSEIELLPKNPIKSIKRLNAEVDQRKKRRAIERIGKDGRCVDVHSLRKTFGTMLARAGVPLTTTQRLMRHSTPVLTAKLYIDVDPLDMVQALGQLEVFCPVMPISPK
jgi:integrase